MDPKLLLLAGLLASLLVVVIFLFSGPSSDQEKTRRLAELNDRYRTDGAGLVESQLRKSIATKQHAISSNLWVRTMFPDPQNLANRIAMTGKDWTLNQFMTVCGGLFVGTAILGLIYGAPLLVAVLGGAAMGLGIPHLIVGRLINKRIAKFTTNFPDALDLMVRGLKSGLPVSETLGLVGTEIDGPVGDEFKLVSERIRIGSTMDQAFQETANRVNTPEFQFFCITIAIQRETGGNLAETLNNLAQVLRQRMQMKLKVRALSSEAKASAYIIGALPFCVFLALMVLNPHYMGDFLIGDPAGPFGLSSLQIAGIGGFIWMGIGAFIMAQMINFEI